MILGDILLWYSATSRHDTQQHLAEVLSDIPPLYGDKPMFYLAIYGQQYTAGNIRPATNGRQHLAMIHLTVVLGDILLLYSNKPLFYSATYGQRHLAVVLSYISP